MGWLGSILRVVMPIAVEHGTQVLRDSLKGRASPGQAQLPEAPNQAQQFALEIEQLKAYSLQLKSDLEALNSVVAAREEKLRKWLLALLIWNITLTTGLIVMVVIALRH